jgi:hypothetical protein
MEYTARGNFVRENALLNANYTSWINLVQKV